ncbi:MAG: hypothetical protein LBV27_06140, partial [Oscillospiraceae bacterium]|nr:hypothetical protein [Oscillospiraceae bacterium]
AITDIIGDIVKETALAALTGRTVNMEEYILTYMRDKINFDRLSDKTAPVSVKLVRQSDDTWLVDNTSVNYAFANALTGGVMGKMSEYADMLDF